MPYTFQALQPCGELIMLPIVSTSYCASQNRSVVPLQRLSATTLRSRQRCLRTKHSAASIYGRRSSGSSIFASIVSCVTEHVSMPSSSVAWPSVSILSRCSASSSTARFAASKCR